jgi:hypothetical protein
MYYMLNCVIFTPEMNYLTNFPNRKLNFDYETVFIPQSSFSEIMKGVIRNWVVNHNCYHVADQI